MTCYNDSDWIEIPDWSIGLFEWLMELKYILAC